MPSFSRQREYTLTDTQVDLILYCLTEAELSSLEDNERRKIVEALDSGITRLYDEDDIENDPYSHYFITDY